MTPTERAKFVFDEIFLKSDGQYLFPISTSEQMRLEINRYLKEIKTKLNRTIFLAELLNLLDRQYLERIRLQERDMYGVILSNHETILALEAWLIDLIDTTRREQSRKKTRKVTITKDAQINQPAFIDFLEHYIFDYAKREDLLLFFSYPYKRPKNQLKLAVSIPAFAYLIDRLGKTATRDSKWHDLTQDKVLTSTTGKPINRGHLANANSTGKKKTEIYSIIDEKMKLIKKKHS